MQREIPLILRIVGPIVCMTALMSCSDKQTSACASTKSPLNATALFMDTGLGVYAVSEKCSLFIVAQGRNRDIIRANWEQSVVSEWLRPLKIHATGKIVKSNDSAKADRFEIDKILYIAPASLRAEAAIQYQLRGTKVPDELK